MIFYYKEWYHWSFEKNEKLRDVRGLIFPADQDVG